MIPRNVVIAKIGEITNNTTSVATMKTKDRINIETLVLSVS